MMEQIIAAGRFKHINCAIRSENFLQIAVRIDVSFVFHILQFIFLNVGPEFFRYFRAWKGTFADNCREIIAYFHRLHKL